VQALLTNTGSNDTATGYQALISNTSGGNNTADGFGALLKKRWVITIPPTVLMPLVTIRSAPITSPWQFLLESISPKGATISISVMRASVASPRQLNPDLVVRDRDGKVYTVRYEAVDAMSLNEFLKEHRKLEQQAADITQLKSTVKVLTASLKEQAS
jgi:hypothetical protein